MMTHVIARVEVVRTEDGGRQTPMSAIHYRPDAFVEGGTGDAWISYVTFGGRPDIYRLDWAETRRVLDPESEGHLFLHSGNVYDVYLYLRYREGNERYFAIGGRFDMREGRRTVARAEITEVLKTAPADQFLREA
ncbi:hypothetical protein [Pyruvatibacter sp.]|uniref:hypothetical protein n=1 Tax=Pyruvatibacter sp. TaxID=1981328 RepID=UPI00326587FA